MADMFVPRPARLKLIVEGVYVLDLRLENSQARQLLARINRLRAAHGQARLSDQDTCDMLIAGLDSELQSTGEGS